MKSQRRNFLGLIHKYGEDLLLKDTRNAEKLFKFFINNTTFLDFNVEFYKSALIVFHKRYSDQTIKESVLKVLSRAELFVNRFLNKYAPDNKSITKKKSLMQYFTSLIISNYYHYQNYDRLDKFLLLFESKEELFKELKNLFFVLGHSDDPRLNTVKVNIFGLFKNYNQVRFCLVDV